jgi:enoyl-CoA hydratase/carnithine racemase
MSQAITVTERPDGVAVLTFDQPGSKANVLTRELWTEFGAALAALRSDLKGLVLASAKPGIFIAGADLKLLANAPGPNDPEVRAFIEQGLRVLEQLEALPFPTCAAIDGAALGGGLEVALACDYCLCGTHPKVQLGLPEVKLGLIPGWGGTQRLPRKTEWDVAVDLLFTGRLIDRQFAIIYGLAVGAESDALIDGAAHDLMTSIVEQFREDRARAAKPVTPPSLSDTPQPPDSAAGRELVHMLSVVQTTAQSEGIKLETEAFMRLAGSEESKRLIAEFFASRKK